MGLEQLIILLIFGAVALAKWYVKRATGNPEDGTSSNRPITPVPPQVLRPDLQETEHERMRKFFEALGVPTTTTPPPKVAPPARQPRLPKIRPLPAEPPKPVFQEPPSMPAQHAPVPAAEPLYFPETPSLAPVPAAASVDRPTPDATSAGSPAPANIRAMVQSADSIRAAILLREILGPPRGLQSYGSSLFSSH